MGPHKCAGRQRACSNCAAHPPALPPPLPGHTRRKSEAHPHAEGQDAEGKPLLALNGAMVDVEASSHGGSGAPGTPAAADAGKPSYAWTASAFYRCLMLEDEALLACRESLRAAVEFGTILAWFFVADRTSIIAPGTKVRSAGGCCRVCCLLLLRGEDI